MYYTVLHLSTMLYPSLLSLHTITVLPLTIVYFVSEVDCTLNVLHVLHLSTMLYLTLLSITVLPLTIVYFVSEVHCTLNVLHSITPYYYAVPDIIKFTYYHCTSIDYSVLCE